jgi:hypothetical protein
MKKTRKQQLRNHYLVQAYSSGKFTCRILELCVCRLCDGVFSPKTIKIRLAMPFIQLTKRSQFIGNADNTKSVGDFRKCLCNQQIVGRLYENGYRLNISKTTDHEPVSFGVNRKATMCDGMPSMIAKQKEPKSSSCTGIIAAGGSVVLIHNYQFSWWDEMGFDPSKYSTFHMCISCALESEFVTLLG